MAKVTKVTKVAKVAQNILRVGVTGFRIHPHCTEIDMAFFLNTTMIKETEKIWKNISVH